MAVAYFTESGISAFSLHINSFIRKTDRTAFISGSEKSFFYYMKKAGNRSGQNRSLLFLLFLLFLQLSLFLLIFSASSIFLWQ